MHFEMPFKMHKIIFFPDNLKKILVSPVNLGRVWLPETLVFFYLAFYEKGKGWLFGKNIFY